MPGLKNLSTRLLLAILLPVVVVFVVSSWIEFQRERAVMLDIAETGATSLSDAVTEELQGVLRSTRGFIDGLGTTLSVEHQSDHSRIDTLLASALDEFALLFGVAFALVPDSSAIPERLARFVYREDGGLTTKDLTGEDYAYWDRSWYFKGNESEGGTWTEPYRGEGANDVPMVTYTRRFDMLRRSAVLTGDLSLELLADIASTGVLGRSASVIVWDSTGRLLVHPIAEWHMDVMLDDLAERLDVDLLAGIPEAILEGRSGWIDPADGLNEGLVGGDRSLRGRMFYRPVNEAGWGIGVYFSDHQFLGDIDAAQRRAMLLTGVLFLVLTVLIVQVTRRGLRPLEDLAAATRSVAIGDLKAETPGRSRTDEIGRMARAFDRMKRDLRIHIDNLTQATARQERIETELETAREIQEMLLPPSTLESGGLRIDGLLQPARAVGGDLYLHRRLPDGRLYFAIGDVSDKGVPAALMMARALAVLESAMVQGLSPGRILATSNETLSEHNELCMFATVLVGEFAPDTGRIRLANAGHEHPILLGGDAPRTVEVPPCAPVGLDVDEPFEEITIELAPGQSLLLYTDGLNEARSPSGELYGEDRMLELLQQGQDLDGPGWLQHVANGLADFVQDAEPADDLTLLVVHRANDGPSASSPGASAKHPEHRSGRLAQLLVEHAHDNLYDALIAVLNGLPEGVEEGQLRLVVEELATNVVKYSGLGADDRLELEWTLESDALELVFIDAGTPFDPLARDAEDAGSDAFEFGGMGITLIRELAESVAYEHRNGTNRLTVRLHRAASSD